MLVRRVLVHLFGLARDSARRVRNVVVAVTRLGIIEILRRIRNLVVGGRSHVARLFVITVVRRLRFKATRYLDVSAPPLTAPPETAQPVCAIVHVHYDDLVSDITSCLGNVAGLSRIVCTHTPEVDPSALREKFDVFLHRSVKVEFIRVENLGRDVLPFLTALDVIDPLEMSTFLKVHTKLSPHLGERGHLWRRNLLHDLAPDIQTTALLTSFMASHPEVTVAIPDRWIGTWSEWGDNRRRTRSLLKAANMTWGRPFVFPKGSMFWFSRQFIEHLRDLKIDARCFEVENAQTDGTLAHVIERCFAMTPRDGRGVRVVFSRAGHPA